VPINPVLIYQAKAWIDMFGYRIFKVVGSVLILLSTQWLPWKLAAHQLSYLVWLICLTWVGILLVLRVDYRHVLSRRERGEAMVINGATSA
jgi:AAA family ATP:ADP antiporter